MTPTRHEQLRALTETFGFRPATVETWSADRIATVLAARQRDARLALARATNRANCIDGTNRGQPGHLERLAAAEYLESVLDKGGDELVNALLHCGHALTDTEARALVEGLIPQLRGEDAGGEEAA
jgi:hypothetical protein